MLGKAAAAAAAGTARAFADDTSVGCQDVSLARLDQSFHGWGFSAGREIAACVACCADQGIVADTQASAAVVRTFGDSLVRATTKIAAGSNHRHGSYVDGFDCPCTGGSDHLG